MIVPKDLKLKSNNSIREGGKGREWGKKGRGDVRFFPEPVEPKHNPCTCRLMLRWCPAMQILTESINLSTMELWNNLPVPDNLRHLDLSLGHFRWALKTHLFWRSLRRLVIFILVRWLYLLTYLLTLQKKQLKQYITSCKTVADTLKITVLNTKTSSAAGGNSSLPLIPHRGLCPLDPRWGIHPRPPL